MAIPTTKRPITLDKSPRKKVPTTEATTPTGSPTMTCKCGNNSPFHWAEQKQNSIFMSDHTFRAKGTDGKSGSQIATDFVESQRELGKMAGSIPNLGKPTKQKEAAVLAYKQFGVYSKAAPSIKKPNKHETDAPSQRKLKELND